MTDLSKLSKAQLVALVEASGTKAPKAARKAKVAKGKRSYTKHDTESFTLVRDPRSDEFGVEYGILAFCDAEGNAHSGALRVEDTLGHELIEEIKSYARANAVGRAKIRYNRSINAWTGRMDMFPARLRKLAEI
jgi:hypothetical protein